MGQTDRCTPVKLKFISLELAEPENDINSESAVILQYFHSFYKHGTNTSPIMAVVSRIGANNLKFRR